MCNLNDNNNLFITTGGRNMSSYYKKINGKNYDKSMLDIADGSTKRKGDGRISLADSKKIIKIIKDGGKITDIEKRTINYILENYKLTETALDHIEKTLSDNINTDIKTKPENESGKSEELNPTKTVYPKADKKNRSKLFLIMLFILFVVAAVLVLIKFFNKSTKPENSASDNKTEMAEQIKEEPKSEKINEVKTTPDTNPIEQKKLSENEYMVKDNDTLIKISESIFGDYKKWEDIYKLNKGKVSNPTIVYPGQILILPDKNTGK